MGKVSNFKLQVCNLNFGQTIGGLKSYDTSVPPGSFLSYIYIYIYIGVLKGERHKSGANWGVLRNSNWANFR